MRYLAPYIFGVAFAVVVAYAGMKLVDRLLVGVC